jgi:hypothetical protein
LDELSCAAAFGIDVLLSLDVHVGVFDPSHNLFVGSHIWSEAVNSCSNETFLDKFHGVFSCYTFEFSLAEFTWINLDATLGSSEGNISKSQLESHEGSKSLNFLEIDVGRISGTTLDWKFVGGVLSSKVKELIILKSFL